MKVRCVDLARRPVWTISELLGSSDLRVGGSFGVAVWPPSEMIFYPTVADLGF